jgi:hypothetical protein
MPESVQQQWLQIATNTLITNTLQPLLWMDKYRPVLVTYGYGIGGRRGKTPYRVVLRDPDDGIDTDTIFFHPHQYTTAGNVLNLLVQSIVTLDSMRRHAGRHSRRRYTIKGMYKSSHDRYTQSALLQRAVQQLEFLLPEFPPAPFNPTIKKQPTRMRLYLCRCRGPHGKVRSCCDNLTAYCRRCHEDYTLQPNAKQETTP